MMEKVSSLDLGSSLDADAILAREMNEMTFQEREMV
jgi:hypothetical protein